MNLIITIGLTHLLALASPGPDLVLVVRNALGKSRKDGYYTAMGFALGVFCHLTIGLFGLTLLLTKIPALMVGLKILGALYLAFIGYKAWSSGSFKINSSKEQLRSEPWISLREGFLTNLLNVKAMLFFFTLLITVLKPEVDLSLKLSAMCLMVTLTFLWFSLVTRFLTIDSIQKRFLGAQRSLERILALLLWALAIKLSGVVEWSLELLA